jgi:RNA binding exosome subunit
MSKSRREQINKVWTNLFKKLSEAQAKSFDEDYDEEGNLIVNVDLQALAQANRLGISLTEYYKRY